MEQERLYERYRELQQYVGWSDEDAVRVVSAWPVIEPHLGELIDDFYDEIDRHPNARKVITGGAEQIARLKKTLRGWVQELFSGRYDSDYAMRRWRVGRRHVDIGLDQIYTNVALSRLRHNMRAVLRRDWPGPVPDLIRVLNSLDRLIDLDLAIIESAYQEEHLERRRQTERLVTIGQVAGGVAHELRNPLNVVKTSVYYLRHARNPTPEKIAEHLERIERQVQVADRVISALNDFVKLPLPEFRRVALEPLLRGVLDETMLPESIRVALNIAPNAAAVLGDERQLGIVFSNLIRNARDAMPEGGELTITAERRQDEVTVAVRDTGRGIKKEDLARVTEPLFSTKARGIGLGLAITRAILEKHGAQMFVESEEGRGATFLVRLTASDGGEAT